MKIGAQMFTMRDFTQNERDLDYTLKAMSEIGYTTVQISAIGQIEAKRVRELCDKYSLEIVLTHTNPDRILFDTKNVIKEHEVMGCKYIGIGAMPKKYTDSGFIHRFVEDYKEPAKEIAESGKLFMYHNHNFEFEKINGKAILDTLVEGFTKDEMGFTLDTYWVQAAGADNLEVIERLKDRIPCVHFKDMGVRGFKTVMEPVGEGNINFKAILQKLEETKMTEHILVEQDECEESPFVCMEKSYKNLLALGLK